MTPVHTRGLRPQQHGIASIVIVGGGFAGLNAALAATRVGDGDVSVTLVSRDPWMTMRPRLYESHPETLRADLTAPLAKIGADFVAGEARDLNSDSVVLDSGMTIGFSRMIVATGSVMQRPNIPGAELACCVDDWASATAFDARLAVLTRKTAPVVGIIGAGFTGLELALEMRDRIAVRAGPEAAQRARVLLLDSAVEVDAELGPGPRPIIRKALADADIETHLGVQIRALGDRWICLEDGATIACDVIVFCTGLRAAPFIAKIKGGKDRFGRLLADAYLRAPDSPNVFVAGDAVCARPEQGREMLMSCQHALMLGRFAGENAARDILGMPLVAYAQPRYVTCLALGRSGAVYCEGWDRIPIHSGARAKSIKTEINTRRIYPPSGTRSEMLDASRLP
jgi:NADH:quinone reductase (non-electrogenic)